MLKALDSASCRTLTLFQPGCLHLNICDTILSIKVDPTVTDTQSRCPFGHSSTYTDRHFGLHCGLLSNLLFTCCDGPSVTV
jgi:hypothetical protein